MWKETRPLKWSGGGFGCWPLAPGFLWGRPSSWRELALELPWHCVAPLLCPFSSRSWNPERSSGRKESAHAAAAPSPASPSPSPSPGSHAYEIMLLYLYTIQGEDPYYVENGGGQGYNSGSEASPEAQGKAIVNRGAQENGTSQATSRNGHSARQRVVADTEL